MGSMGPSQLAAYRWQEMRGDRHWHWQVPYMWVSMHLCIRHVRRILDVRRRAPQEVQQRRPVAERQMLRICSRSCGILRVKPEVFHGMEATSKELSMNGVC
jgi:hypothetical protein